MVWTNLLVLILFALCCCAMVTPQENEQCKIFFTAQPPLNLPCNPQTTLASPSDARFSLQCTIHAPILDIDLPERNFTIEWVRQTTTSTQDHTPGSTEEVISVATSRTDLTVENQQSAYFYGPSSSHFGTYVDSTLSFDLNHMTRSDIIGTYWCRVLVKTLDNYSYTVAGRSNTETVIASSEDGLPLPPCVGGMKIHQPLFKCVQDNTIVPTNGEPRLDPGPEPNGDVSISSGGLAAVAVTGGVLIVALLIMVFVVVYSCKVGSAGLVGKGTAAVQRNRISMQSTETQEEECGGNHMAPRQKSISSKPHPQMHPLDYKQSIGRNSYRVKMEKQQFPQHMQQPGSHQRSNSTLYSSQRKENGSSTSFL